MNKTINIALVGVGGQGILLASDVISRAAMLCGWDVKKSEVHGMAQRGGSVVSQVRFGERVYSPIIEDGETDFLVSFELLESLRYVNLLSANGTALINSQIILPVTVSSGQQPWVDDIDERIERAYPRRRVINALSIARDLGNTKAVNMVMAGSLSCLLELKQDAWDQAVIELVPTRHRDVNLAALTAGRREMVEETSA